MYKFENLKYMHGIYINYIFARFHLINSFIFNLNKRFKNKTNKNEFKRKQKRTNASIN